jgi:hypothetical protein
MKSFLRPDPENAAPGEIVGICPLTFSPEESVLLRNHLYGAAEEYPVCHYLNARRFEQLLESAALSLRRLDLYGDDDPIEGLYPEANRHGLAPADIQIAEQMNIAERDYEAFLRSQEIHRTHCYAHCWFGIPREDADMWEQFGDHNRGVCIVTTTHRLMRAISKDPALFYELGKVTYWPEDKPLPDIHSSTVMFRKRPKFKAENEVRLLVQFTMDHLVQRSEDFPDRLAVAVDLSILVAGFIFGPQMTEELQRALRTKANAKIPRAKILRSRFDVRP